MESKWKSIIKDGYPPKDLDILVYAKENDKEYYAVMRKDYHYDGVLHGTYWTPSFIVGYDYEIVFDEVSITHWRELPTPPNYKEPFSY